LAASKREENTISVGIGIGVAVAIGCMGLKKPIATAIATPIPMIANQSEHDLSSSTIPVGAVSAPSPVRFPVSI
jgi:hypothetical protein